MRTLPRNGLLLMTSRSSVSPERQSVVSLPRLSATGSGVVVLVTLSEATGLLASGGKTTSFTVLVNGVDDPVDSRISSDGLVAGVNKDNLEVLVCAVLVDPVAVQDTQVGASSSNTLLSGRSERSLVLELVNTLVGRLAVGGTLSRRTLTATSADSASVDDVTLLGLVPKTAGLVRTRWATGAVDDVQLSELPASDSQQESKDIGLLLLVKLFHVFEGTHLE